MHSFRLMASPETTREYFNRMADRYAANYRALPEFVERTLVWRSAVNSVQSRLPDRAMCLDMGCGDGWLSRLLASKGYTAVGMDQSDTMLALARKKTEDDGLAARVQYHETALPLGEELLARYRSSADLVICSSVLEYIAEYRLVVEQFHHLLKPGGTLLLSLPNGSSLYRRCERLARVFANRDSYLWHQHHLFTADKMKDVLERIGYRTIDHSFFALPHHRYVAKILGSYRGRWLAAMLLVTAQKSPDVRA